MIVPVTGSLFSIPLAFWLAGIVDLALKGGVLVVIAWSIARCSRRCPAALRSLVWTTTFVLLVALPLVHIIRPALDLPGTPAWQRPVLGAVRFVALDAPHPDDVAPSIERGRRMDVDAPRSARSVSTGSHAVSRLGTSALDGTLPAPTPAPWLPLLVPIWLIGVVVLGTRMIHDGYRAMIAARRAVRVGHPELQTCATAARAEIDLRRPVTLRYQTRGPVPFVVGWRRPALILPEGAVKWPRQFLRHVLLHELAHVKRHDLLRLLLVELVRALHWFNPLVWRAADRATLEFEMACDEVVLEAGGSAPDYARQLLSLATTMSGERHAHAVLAMARSSNLEARLRGILRTPPARPRWPRIGGVLAVALLIVGFLPLAMWQIAQPSSSVADDGGRRPGDTARAAAITPYEAGRLLALGNDEPSPQAPSSNPESPASSAGVPELHAAAVLGDVATVQDIIRRRQDLIDVPDDRGMTPLALAAWNDRTATVTWLLEAGAGRDLENANGLTPLFSAVDRGRVAIALLLIEAGADMHVRGYRGRNLLHMIARLGDLRLAPGLIEAGVPINARDRRGATPLTIAVARGHMPMVTLLLEHGAEMNDSAMTARLQSDLQSNPDDIDVTSYLGPDDVTTVEIWTKQKRMKLKEQGQARQLHVR